MSDPPTSRERIVGADPASKRGERSEAGPSDLEAVKRAAKGDHDAFRVLVERYQDRAFGLALRVMRDEEQARDAVQDAFLKVYRSLDRFEGRSSFGSWIQRIKVNHCLNFLRKRKGRVFVDVQDPVTETEPDLAAAATAERDVAAQDERERIRLVLDELPETLRVPLIMRDLDGMAYQEIADGLGVGLSAVKMRIKRGREEFRRLYDRSGEPEPMPVTDAG